jgi:DNA-binding CsgD family transcriptional regulator
LCRLGRRRDAARLLTRARSAFAALDVLTVTDQERTVAGLVATGKSNREVANEMMLSVKTVQFHLTRI